LPENYAQRLTERTRNTSQTLICVPLRGLLTNVIVCCSEPRQLLHSGMASDRVAWKNVSYVWGGSDDFRHQLRPGGRSASRSSPHDHKYSSIRSSLSYLWQNLHVRIRAPESSSSFSPSVS